MKMYNANIFQQNLEQQSLQFEITYSFARDCAYEQVFIKLMNIKLFNYLELELNENKHLNYLLSFASFDFIASFNEVGDFFSCKRFTIIQRRS